MTNQLTGSVSEEGFDVLFGDESEECPPTRHRRVPRAWFVTVLSALLLVVAGLCSEPFCSAVSHRHRQIPSVACSRPALARRAVKWLECDRQSAGERDVGYRDRHRGQHAVRDDLQRLSRSGQSELFNDGGPKRFNDGRWIEARDTVTVQGKKEKGGTVKATSISDTEKGVTSTGFGGAEHSHRTVRRGTSAALEGSVQRRRGKRRVTRATTSRPVPACDHRFRARSDSGLAGDR